MYDGLPSPSGFIAGRAAGSESGRKELPESPYIYLTL